MRIVVCVKQVFDPQTVRISRTREELDLRQAVRITNPSDRFAVEAALRLRELEGAEVVALTLGDAAAEDAVHEAIAMGADRGVLVTGPLVAQATGAGVARALAAAIERLAPVDLVLTGSGGLVDGTGALPGRLAAALKWPALLDVVCFDRSDGGLQATVAGDGAASLRAVPVPAVAAIVPGGERPRYPHPARIANAWQPGLVEVWEESELGLRPEALAPESVAAGLVLSPERVRGEVIGGSADEAAEAVANILRSRRII